MIKHVKVILWKQIKDTLKNKTILIQFIMFPILTVIMENAIEIQGMPEHYFALMFGVMYVGMAPLTSMATIISEEKGSNTLRVLLMSNVKPVEYLLGVGIYIWVICMIGACVIGVAGKYSGSALGSFIVIMGIGILVSILIGAAIGTWSKNPMMATSVSIPVMLIFSFLPMLSMFNEGIAKVAKIIYSQQMNLLLGQVENVQIGWEPVAVIGGNILVAAVLFVVAYRRSGLE